jgi:hypothetical protein
VQIIESLACEEGSGQKYRQLQRNKQILEYTKSKYGRDEERERSRKRQRGKEAY